ncbi:endonuclease domain-containing protein [Pedobacter mendelii]|uniref:Endonuclease n=1 Tax=Pedobacter mendelii TaxID=1908240 RepID=A0ABQ2BLC6_9SPHI|nr:endonuclease domain-containing protein [Pedobacter mendelii]GGI27023.1 endonuclease [Pedobacter mendelii]
MDEADKNNLWHYNTGLKKFANSNRKDMTKAEACLWKFVLSGKQMMGYQFRRQRPILNFIVDFMCKELMLVIEVDGLTHSWENVAENDITRDKLLADIGFSVLRFNDDEILTDIENVNRAICFYVEAFEWESKNHPL